MNFVPLFRLFHPASGDHFYTTYPEERDRAKTRGYLDEGIVGYVIPVCKKTGCTDPALYDTLDSFCERHKKIPVESRTAAIEKYWSGVDASLGIVDKKLDE